MRTTIHNIVFTSLLILGIAFVFPVWGFAVDEPSEAEIYLLELFNNARNDPAEVARSMGMDVDQLIAENPDFEKIAAGELTPLVFEDRLQHTARLHTLDMINNSFYSSDSLDGRTCEERIIDSGYLPSITGESLGLVAFFNYINPVDAAYLMFEQILRNELTASGDTGFHVLNPDIREVGICQRSCVYNIDETACNAYMATCDFATEDLSLIARDSLVWLINQARRDPLGMALILGLDTEDILENFPEMNEILVNGLPPLIRNDALGASASGHVRDMLENSYYSRDSLDGRTVESRAADAGYLMPVHGELLGSLASGASLAPILGAMRIFESRFKAELDPAGDSDWLILNPQVREVGVGYEVVALTSEENETAYYYLMVCDFGEGSADDSPAIVVLVYEDQNDNGRYDLCEGRPGIPIIISREDGEEVINGCTDSTGGYIVHVPPGVYRIDVSGESRGPIEVNLEDVNKLLWLEY